MKTKSPTPTLPKGEGGAPRYCGDSFFAKIISLQKFTDEDIQKSHSCTALRATPSPWGRAGVGLLLLLYACITDFEPKGIEEVADILVVEGIITDNETTITLSRSVNLSNYGGEEFGRLFVHDAKVYVECDDGTQFMANPSTWDGRYRIKTGQLDLKRKYCLKIEIEDIEYHSDFSHPINTPEIDSIFWLKGGSGQPVKIYLATNSPQDDLRYYRWSYKEDWEINSAFLLEPYPYYCWNKAESEELLLGTAEKTEFGQMMEIISEIAPSSDRFSVLYRVDITQNAINKRAYDYFLNIKKNAENTGTIFAPIPSELRGNIRCLSDPKRPVIGYVDVSTTTKKSRYIYRREGVYEPPYRGCFLMEAHEICEMENIFPCIGLPYYYIVYDRFPPVKYLHQKCVDCTFLSSNTTQKPNDWPN